jgi:pilus assembly protein Flp/PilA
MFRKRSKGQGLVEYALILVLVAVVVIVIVSVLGEAITETFCEVLYALGDAAPEVEACERPHVSCSAPGGVISGGFNIEALVKDNKGNTQPNITKVEFFIDGEFKVREFNYRYCLGTGDSTCGTYNSHTLSNGSHIVRAVATDADGYTGSCEVNIVVGN